MKRLYPYLFISLALLLLAGCSNDSANGYTASPSESLSVSPQASAAVTESLQPKNTDASDEISGTSDYNSNTPNSDSSAQGATAAESDSTTLQPAYGDDSEVSEIPDFDEFSLAELISYYKGSDGAHAEGVIHELYLRFKDSPLELITVISEENEEFQRSILLNLSAYPFGSADENEITDFESTLYSLEAIPHGTAAAGTSELMLSIYEQYKDEFELFTSLDE